MSISKIAKEIKPSATLKLNAKVAELREKGAPVIHLGAGEPKSKAPGDAITAAVELLKTGEVRYTPAGGIPALKKAIVQYTEKHYGHRFKPSHVMASGGAKQAIMVALQATLNPDDEVVFPCPYWVSYPEMVRLCGAKPIAITPADGTFYPKIGDIEHGVTDRTKVIIINSPNNPSGIMYSEEFIADIVAFCEKRDLYLIMDDIYHRLIFDGRALISCYSFAKDSEEDSKLIVVNGASKQYAMTGFRIGWAIANTELIEVMTDIQGHQTSGPSVISQRAAIGALDSDQSSVEDLRRTLEKNRDVLVEQLKSFRGVKFTKPDGTFYCFVDFREYEKDSTKLAEMLLEKALVVTVPGIEFGMDGFLRLSYCGSEKDIVEGIARMKWALDPSAPPKITIGDCTLRK